MVTQTATATKQSTDEAISEPARLFAEEGRWSERRRAAVASLAAATGTAGGALLDGGESVLREQSAELARLRAGIDLSDAAIGEARRRRSQAILAVWSGEAADLRGEAAKLLAEAGDRQKKTDRMLAALARWENVPYVPEPPARPDTSEGVAGGAPQIVHVPTPYTELLRIQAAGLEQRAAQLEARTVKMGGAVEAQDRAEVLRVVADLDAVQIGPTLAAVETWLEEAEAPVLERRSRLPTSAVGHGAPLRYSLHWSDGEIDSRRSRCSLPALDD